MVITMIGIFMGLLLSTVSTEVDHSACIIPVICRGQPNWMKLTKFSRETFGGCDDELKKIQDKYEPKLNEFQKQLVELEEILAAKKSATITTTASTTPATAIAQTTPQEENDNLCYDACENISSGKMNSRPVGFATSGTAATIFPEFSPNNGIEVYCDCSEGSSGAWIVFQRRIDGSHNFNRGWDDYVAGFGSLVGEFWLGLETIHNLTQSGRFEVKVDLMDFNNEKTYSLDRKFSIGNAEQNYILEASDTDIDSPTGSEFIFNSGFMFSTPDRVNTINGVNCGERLKGGWWFGAGFQDCRDSNLNGIYYPEGELPRGKYYDGIYWDFWKGLPQGENVYSLQATEIKIRKSMKK